MANPGGHASTLVAAHPGNENALRHGLYSARRELPERAREIAEDLLALPHVTEADRPAAEELGALTVLLENVDRALADGRVEGGRGQVRALLETRRRLSAELRAWLEAFGGTPAARAEWAARLAAGGLAGEIARRRAT
jgi:hypothetical protein